MVLSGAGSGPLRAGSGRLAAAGPGGSVGHAPGPGGSVGPAPPLAGSGRSVARGSGGFDSHRPPSAETIADCVHCGFCLPACPTYALWGEEMDSPRGRILIMRSVLEGTASLGDSFVGHIDACLGCMACVPACPSGVLYDQLIEATRAQVERHYTRSLSERIWREAIFAVFPQPGRVRVAALVSWAYQALGLDGLVRASGLLERLSPRMQALESLVPPVRLRRLVRRLPPTVPATGERRLRVGLVTGCVQAVFFGEVNTATSRVLAAEGCSVEIPRGQGCCGALMLHAGREADALGRARALIERFEALSADSELDVIAVNAAGCGSTLKDYGRLLADDPDWSERAAAFSSKVRDVSEVLASFEARAPRHPIHARIAYQDACHLAQAQGVRKEPRAVLGSIPGLELVELADDMCCGSAGIYNLVQPAPAAELGRRKAEMVRAAGVDALASANPGCLLQLRRYLGTELPMLHPIELLDASIRGRDPLAARRRGPEGPALGIGQPPNRS